MNRKDKNKQKKNPRLASSSSGTHKKTASNSNDNLLVLDDYPPRPIPINSVKPTGVRHSQNENRDTQRPLNPASVKDKGGQIKAKKNQNMSKKPWRRMLSVVVVFLATAFAGGVTLLRRARIGRTAILAAVCVAAIAVIAASLYFLLRNNAFGIEVDGEQVAIVSMASVRSGGEDVSEELVRQARLRIEARVGTRVLINEQVEFEPMRARRSDFLSTDEAIIRLDSALTFRVEAAAINIEGARMAIVHSYYDANRVLNTIKEPYLSFGIEFAEVGFVENVSIGMIYVEQDYVQEISMALQILTSTFEAAVEYSVVSGDSLELIASRSDMTLAELLLINPMVNPAAPLSIGTVLRLNIDQPMLSVRTAEAISTTAAIDPSVEYIYSPALRSPQRRVYRPGTLGEATVIEHVIRVNGMITERIEVERIVTREAEPEIIEVGTG